MENDKEKMSKPWKSRESEIEELEDFDDTGTRCGFGSFKPDWLQCLARKEMYILIYCINGLTIGMFFTYTVSVLSTIEKRFKFSSKITGVILAGNDISQVLLCILISYFGNYGHRPRWVAIGAISGAISSLLAGAPHILYGPGEEAERYSNLALQGSANISSAVDSKDDTSDGLCYLPFEQTCDADAQGLDSEAELGAVVLLFISHFFVGITISIFYSIGFTYLDDNIDKKEMPFYYALSLILRTVGPVLGYFMGSRCLKLWITPSIEPNLTIKDPRWVGAWWLGYVALGFLTLLFSLPFFFFPRKLPEAAKREALKAKKESEKSKLANSVEKTKDTSKSEKEVQGTKVEAKKMELEVAHKKRDSNSKEAESRGKEGKAKETKVSKFVTSLMGSPSSKTGNDHQKPSLKNLPKALLRLFTNKLWMGNMCGTLTFAFALAGYWYFKPKYLENQFRKSASDANFYTGVASLVASVIGLALSGAILRWVRPRARVVAGYGIFLTLFSAASMFTLMFIGCPKLDIKGPIPGASPLECSFDCNCSDRFVPVCSQDGVTVFYSPCHAGCTVSNNTASPIEYSNCKCIPNSPNLSASSANKFAYELEHLNSSVQEPLDIIAEGHDQESLWGKATRGFCDEDCNAFTLYIIIQIITKTVGATGRVSYTLIHLRAVAEEDKALALGTFTVLLSLFTYIPCPIVMGAIIDSACLIWEDRCGHQGNCWLYDSDKFRVIIHAVPAALILISVLGDIVIFRYSDTLKLYGEEDDDEEEEKEKENGDKTKATLEIEASISQV
ncbi:solute carrier organic anion transporter family member 74D-like [Oratosquilla oratoria]|uniref:solute carrier organic anion transporter family member 74D-like n=1 Tax=Oratosquilla oratoria TaxID=337810 RepID=UPI003F762EF6